MLVKLFSVLIYLRMFLFSPYFERFFLQDMEFLIDSFFHLVF